MYKKYKPPLYSIPEKHESQDDLPVNWIPKKKHEVLRVKYKCLKRLFKVYDSQINNLIEEYLKLRVNSDENIEKKQDIKQKSLDCDSGRNCLEQCTTTNSLNSLNHKLQKCTIGPLLFEVIGDHLTDLSSRESLKLPKEYLTNSVNKDISFQTRSSEENFDHQMHSSCKCIASCSLARHDEIHAKNDVIKVTNYDDFKNYFDREMETSTQDLLESILACTQTSKSLFEDGNSIYLSRKLSLIQYLRRKLCNRNRPSTTKSDIVDKETRIGHSVSTNSHNRATAVSEPIYDRRMNEPRKYHTHRRRRRRRIHFKQFNSRNRIASNQNLICEQSKIRDLSAGFEKCCVSSVSPKRSPTKVDDSLSFRSSISNERHGNHSNYYEVNSHKDVKANAKEIQYAKSYPPTQNRQNNFSMQSRSSTNISMYKCNFCHKQFKLKISRDIHENTRHSFTKLVNRFTTFSKENDEPYFETSLRREPPVEILTPVARRFKNHNCIKKASQKRVCNIERKYYCKECNTIFLNREDLEFHIRLTHDVSKYHICKICSSHFESRSELNEHCNQYHIEDNSTCGSFYDYDEKSSSEENDVSVEDSEQRKKHRTGKLKKNNFRKYNSLSASSSVNNGGKNRIPYYSYKSISQKSRSSPIFRRRNSTDSSDSMISQKNETFEEIKRDLKGLCYQKNKNSITDDKYLNRRWQTASRMKSM